MKSFSTISLVSVVFGRSSHEERGLKSLVTSVSTPFAGRSSHEERGLKYAVMIRILSHAPSLLSRGAWIEIVYFRRF